MPLAAANIFKDSYLHATNYRLASAPQMSTHTKRFPSCKITSAVTCVFICVDMVGIKVKILHVRPSNCMHEHVSQWTGYSEIFLLETYENITRFLNLFKIEKNIGHLT